MEKLYEDMKDAHIKLAYDIKEKKFDYKEIKIGQKNYNKINDIGNNEIPRDKYVGWGISTRTRLCTLRGFYQ